jgi:hypothetical protein
MSAQLKPQPIIYLPSEERRKTKPEDEDDGPRKIPSVVVYQVLFAPEPTPEELAREAYLLECD